MFCCSDFGPTLKGQVLHDKKGLETGSLMFTGRQMVERRVVLFADSQAFSGDSQAFSG